MLVCVSVTDSVALAAVDTRNLCGRPGWAGAEGMPLAASAIAAQALVLGPAAAADHDPRRVGERRLVPAVLRHGADPGAPQAPTSDPCGRTLWVDAFFDTNTWIRGAGAGDAGALLRGLERERERSSGCGLELLSVQAELIGPVVRLLETA